jgi:sulfotransferase 6B1
MKWIRTGKMPNFVRDLKASAKFQAKLLRRLWRRTTREVVLTRTGHASIKDAPMFFANSFPKSGTHLLTQVLEGFPLIGPAVNTGLPAVVMYEGASGRERGNDEIFRDLAHLSSGDIGYGHLHARPEIVDFFTRQGVCAYFILRDPRDVVISHVHYVTKMEPNHVHHQYYAEVLQTFDERLKTSILGRPEALNPFPDIAGRFAPFLDWLDHPEVLCLKYEDFLTDRKAAVQSVLSHAISRGFRLFMNEDRAGEQLEAMINPQKSPTFRQGKSGGWKTQFSPENKAIFKDIAGDLLVRLGYEKDANW